MSRRARVSRALLAVLHGTVAATALVGGMLMIAGTVAPALRMPVAPPTGYLDDSPFRSYLIPGILLAVVVGGAQLVAFVAQLRSTPRAAAWSAVAAFDVLIWIFVQMIWIPFSPLQAAYFAAGVAEAGLVMLSLGVLRPVGRRTV
ncbi:hypothetical protein [Pseudolysinimonas sp.]|uniref:hypothetical protein n=1 Tax=Pseudolysinimonas sp. TaxID=2680009 RepID=UPI003F7DA1B9